jgi:cobyrinic acid a,c-diamide synthase
VNADGGYSTAELAVMLDLPVILVVNCTKTTRTVAAMVLGCRDFDKRVDIRGVILNQVATERQRSLITEAVEKYCHVPVLGAIPRLKRDIFPMRHLGMIPYQEYGDSPEAITFLVELVTKNIDLTRLDQVMAELPVPDIGGMNSSSMEPVSPVVRLGILQDAAFQFYYSENLEALELGGAKLVYINAMEDERLPDIDGLYIGGGFPETSARELAANESFRDSVREAADAGLPIYAECGGLIYLGRSIVLADGNEYPLVNLFPIRFGMTDKPQAHGYTILKTVGQNSFYQQGKIGRAHV